jgi:hypothetical protein
MIIPRPPLNGQVCELRTEESEPIRLDPNKQHTPTEANYVTLTGRGVYVGDTLTVMNPVPTWWGEGDADTKTNRTADAAGAARPIVPPPPARPQPQVRHFENAVECETMKIVAKSGDFSAAPQPLDRHGGHRWSGANHLFVRAGKIGDFIEVRFPVEGDEPCKLILHATQSHDYGVLRLTVNGLPTGEDVDTYAEKPGPFGPLKLGVFKPVDGAFTLRAEVVGKNAKSGKTGTYFGLDCVVVSQGIVDTAPHGGK